MSSLFSGSLMNPTPQTPTVGTDVQTAIFQALMGAAQFKQNPDGTSSVGGQTPYPGPTSPDVNNTILPKVASSWQPWDGGTQKLAQNISEGVYDPRVSGTQQGLHEIMYEGGTQGSPGTNYMNAMAMFGAPSQAGQYAGNMAQYGVSGQQAGQPLTNLAYGVNSGPAQYLTPFLQAGMSPYRAPQVTIR